MQSGGGILSLKLSKLMGRMGHSVNTEYVHWDCAPPN